MNDQIQFIRQKCIEANPEIKERVWKFYDADFVAFHGEVINVPAKFQYWLIKLTEMDAAIRLWEEGTDGKGERQIRVYEHRPIRLADVLLAYDDSFLSNERRPEDKVLEITMSWDWRKDSLEDQSEETINFIANLLTNTEDK